MAAHSVRPAERPSKEGGVSQLPQARFAHMVSTLEGSLRSARGSRCYPQTSRDFHRSSAPSRCCRRPPNAALRRPRIQCARSAQFTGYVRTTLDPVCRP